jgi:hypothetical protein
VGLSIALDSGGNAYVAGTTNSTDFPTVNPLQGTYGGGNSDLFVAKLNSAGSTLVYSTYLGGSGSENEDENFMAVDSAGNAYVTGATASTDFPTVNPLQAANSGANDAFVSKLNPAGSALIYSTYLGGGQSDNGESIAVDALGNMYIAGRTTSTDFPTMNPLQRALGGNADMFVAKLNPIGSALIYSTYLGGNGDDEAFGIAVDSNGSVYVTGDTQFGICQPSCSFPRVRAVQSAFGGGISDAVVAKLNATGTALAYSTYLGGSGDEQGLGIAVDIKGNSYIIGVTNSTDFPTVNSLQQTLGGGANSDAFVTKLNSAGTAFIYSTYLGGSGNDLGLGIAVDSDSSAYVTGYTFSSDFPTKNPLHPVLQGAPDAFIAKIFPVKGGQKNVAP